MYDFVTPQKPLDALRFLKCDIEINQQWLEEARLLIMMMSLVCV